MNLNKFKENLIIFSQKNFYFVKTSNSSNFHTNDLQHKEFTPIILDIFVPY